LLSEEKAQQVGADQKGRTEVLEYQNVLSKKKREEKEKKGKN